MTQDEKDEYNRLLNRAARQHMSQYENRRLNQLSQMNVNDRKHHFEYEWDDPINQVDMEETKRNISITSKIDDKIIVTQLDLKTGVVIIAEPKRIIFEGSMKKFKLQVARMEDSIYSKCYGEILSLAEDIESVLSSKE